MLIPNSGKKGFVHYMLDNSQQKNINREVFFFSNRDEMELFELVRYIIVFVFVFILIVGLYF